MKKEKEENEARKRKKYGEGQDDISEEEVRRVIKKMKKRKMPGENGIMNEAWIEGIEEIEKDLTVCLNKRWNR